MGAPGLSDSPLADDALTTAKSAEAETAIQKGLSVTAVSLNDMASAGVAIAGAGEIAGAVAGGTGLDAAVEFLTQMGPTARALAEVASKLVVVRDA